MSRADLLVEDARRSLRGVPTDSLDHKTILITGASGIIGSHLLFALMHCQRDLRLELEVVAVVQHGLPDFLKPLEEDHCIRTLVGNMADARFVETLPPADIIVHAATYGQPGLFLQDTMTTLKLNTSAVFELIDKLSSGGQFLFMSSSEVYSGLTTSPFSEEVIGTTNTCHPRSSYIEAKRCGEAICHSARSAGIDAKAARLSLAYGPGTRVGDRRVLNNFIEKAIRQREIRLLDRGASKRTYCYISDALHMLWRILLEGKQAVYNVGGNSTTTIVQLAEEIGELLNVPVRVPPEAGSGLAGAPDDVRLDLTRFCREFGEFDFVTLHDGLARTVAWQRELYAN
jgi:UDP-glucuronate decarboxylase